MPDSSAANQVANLDPHDLATTQIVVYGEVRRRAVAQTALMFEGNLIAHTSFGLSGCFAPSIRPLFQGGDAANAGS